MEEVVAQADPLELEQFGPDAGENALRLSARHILCVYCVANRKVGRKVRRGQRAAINLAIWRYWYGIEKDESRRNHLLRQTLCQKLTQLLRCQLVSFDDYIRY